MSEIGTHDPSLTNADLAPVGPERRTWNWWHIAALWIGMAICIPTYTLASSLVDSGWTWQAAVGAVILGNVVVLVPIALNSHAGTRYGIPFPVLVPRLASACWAPTSPRCCAALVACGWFGIQTWIGGWAIYKLLEVLWPGIATLPRVLPGFVGLGTGEFLCFMLFWAINVWIVLRGMDSIKFLETWGSPFLLLVGVALLVWAWVRAGGFGPMLDEPGRPAHRRRLSGVFGAGLTSAVAFWGTMALSIPDFSRFARSQRDQIIGQAVGLPGTMALFAFIGAAVTNATVVIFGTRIADPVALLARIGGPAMIILSMVGLVDRDAHHQHRRQHRRSRQRVFEPGARPHLVQGGRGDHGGHRHRDACPGASTTTPPPTLHLADRVRRAARPDRRHHDRRLLRHPPRASPARRSVPPRRGVRVPARRQLGGDRGVRAGRAPQSPGASRRAAQASRDRRCSRRCTTGRGSWGSW